MRPELCLRAAGPYLVSQLKVEVLDMRLLLGEGQALEEGDDLLLPKDALQHRTKDLA